jgi:hypothetical protein
MPASPHRPRTAQRTPALPLLGLGQHTACLIGLLLLVLGCPAGNTGWTANATVRQHSAPAPRGPQGTGSAIGVNLVYQAYWSSQQPFIDLFKGASNWLPQHKDGWEWDTGEPLDLDPQGWVRRLRPGQAAGVLMVRGLGGRYPGGAYTLFFDGEGRIELLGDGEVLERRGQQLKVKVTPSDAGIHLKLLETDPKDPLRNIRLIPDGSAKTYQDSPFRADFLTFLEPFSTLRFMDWQRTNDSSWRTVGQRITPAHHSQAGDLGVALEYAIELLNILDKDGWFCVPHELDDAGVRAMAQLVRQKLEPGRTAFVEFSNEVWNDSFGQARWAQEQGQSRKLSKNPFEARLRAYSERACQVLKIWSEVFGADSKQRLVRVLAGQSANPWTAEVILSWQNAAQHADAYAVAPYFGHSLGSPERLEEVLGASEVGLFAWLDKDLEEVLTQTRENARIARLFGLPLVAYEGGQHLAGYGGTQNSPELTARFHNANRSQRMGQLYGRYLAGWKAAGGGLFCHWNSIETYTEWGSWGLVESVDQPRSAAPKLDALLSFAKAHPRWW